MGESMKAVQYRAAGDAPEVVRVDRPSPGPGQVLLRVLAAGACHSDIAVMDRPADALSFPLPLTLGHEAVGTVVELGAGAAGVRVGEDVAVYGAWGCGTCPRCAVGEENLCPRARELGLFPPGLGAPGAMAEYLLVDSPRHLVPLGGLDPVRAVPLTDAGLTPYHAVRRSLAKLVPGSTAVVVGVGGLGHLAVQILRALTPARVVALDVREDKLALAREVGAHETVPSDAAAPDAVNRLTGGDGAEVVLDFVGGPATVALAGACAAAGGDVTIVGLGGGALPVGFGTLRHGVCVCAPYWGTRGELLEVLALARAGALSVRTETCALDDAPAAYERLRAGAVTGRAVVLPHA